MSKKPIILPEGFPFILVTFFFGVVLYYMKWYYLAVIPFIVCLYFTYFFPLPAEKQQNSCR